VEPGNSVSRLLNARMSHSAIELSCKGLKQKREQAHTSVRSEMLISNKHHHGAAMGGRSEGKAAKQ
jgi:hypothetical protein